MKQTRSSNIYAQKCVYLSEEIGQPQITHVEQNSDVSLFNELITNNKPTSSCIILKSMSQNQTRRKHYQCKNSVITIQQPKLVAKDKHASQGRFFFCQLYPQGEIRTEMHHFLYHPKQSQRDEEETKVQCPLVWADWFATQMQKQVTTCLYNYHW